MTQEEVIAYIRIILGNVPDTTLPDTVIILFYNRWSLYFDLANNPEKLPLVLWNTCVSCLHWLLTATTVSGDTYTSKSEQVGDVKVSISGGTSQYKAWKDLLDFITENPDYVDPTLSNKGLTIVVGGVRQSILDEVRKNPDSRGWDKVDSVVRYREESSTRNTNYIYHLGDIYD